MSSVRRVLVWLLATSNIGSRIGLISILHLFLHCNSTSGGACGLDRDNPYLIRLVFAWNARHQLSRVLWPGFDAAFIVCLAISNKLHSILHSHGLSLD